MIDLGKSSNRPYICLKGLLWEARNNEEDEIIKEIRHRIFRNGKICESENSRLTGKNGKRKENKFTSGHIIVNHRKSKS